MILKNIWNFKAQTLTWDAPLPQQLEAQWMKFTEELKEIDQITVPRWINYSPTKVQSIELHVFCDGSSSAYAANVYIRLDCGERVYTHLIIAKSKITPTKPLTIPRVELCAAELATRLATWVNKSIRISVEKMPIYFWSDAMIVLYWIKGDISRWKTYVANRVSKILSESSPHQWNHVDTKENPADCATRGLSPTQLAKFDLWWKGPPWLTQPSTNWPQFNANEHIIDENPWK